MNNDSDDPIAEIRQTRAKIVSECGNDLDRLFQHLQEVGRDYTARRGIFASVTPERAREVEQSWGDMSGPVSEPIIDEIREIRRGLAAHDLKGE